MTTTAVSSYLASLHADWRELAPGEWGLSVDAAGWPLHVGLALRDGLLHVQAEVAAAGALDPHELLHRNRRRPLVRFSHTSAGAVWVQAELPQAAVTEGELDRLLGLVFEAAEEARSGLTPPGGGTDPGRSGSPRAPGAGTTRAPAGGGPPRDGP